MSKAHQGLEPPYSCAGGACGTCRAKVLLGKAAMDQNHVLDDGEINLGYVLTCQAHSVTEEVRLDYDTRATPAIRRDAAVAPRVQRHGHVGVLTVTD